MTFSQKNSLSTILVLDVYTISAKNINTAAWITWLILHAPNKMPQLIADKTPRSWTCECGYRWLYSEQHENGHQ